MNRRLMLKVTLAAAWLGMPLAMGADKAATSKAPGRYVRVVIDYGDGVEKHFTRIPARKDMTVLDALLEAQKHARGIRLRYRGKGATAFVTRIDNLENEGRGRNWIYRVNGKLADRSCGLCKVKGGDTVLWQFGKYR